MLLLPAKPPIKLSVKIIKYSGIILLLIVLLAAIPVFFALSLKQKQSSAPVSAAPSQFPVTVDPQHKLITENIEVNTYLESNQSPLGASVIGATPSLVSFIQSAFESVAVAISNIPLYQNLASVSGLDGHFVTITPGMRKEQVADAFGKALDWTTAQKKEFITPDATASLPLAEGSFFPDTYFVDDSMSPSDVQDLLNTDFTENVLAHYGTSTADIVPLDQALTIASIIQRETIDNTDMRLVSGIIWNRIFNGMNLQVDSTLQYAKANLSATTQWWPNVVPKDKYIKSPYNTYLNNGLPPTPIANPSVGAIVAALNPIKTTCLYYFNDKEGNFHCSDTYAEHTALLKKYYPGS